MLPPHRSARARLLLLRPPLRRPQDRLLQRLVRMLLYGGGDDAEGRMYRALLLLFLLQGGGLSVACDARLLRAAAHAAACQDRDAGGVLRGLCIWRVGLDAGISSSLLWY